MAMMDLIPLDEQTEKMVLALMNAEHPDAIRLYARHFGGKGNAASAILVHVDHEKMSVRYLCPAGKQGEVSIPYVDASGAATTARTVGECRRALVGMARVAAEALGESIELPEARSTDLPGGASEAPLSSAAPEGAKEMLEMMQQIQRRMAEEQSKSSSEGNLSSSATSSGPFSGVRTINGGTASASSQASVFKGEGSRLGSASAGPSTPAVNMESAQLQLREVDPEKPLVRLRVQLLDRKPANVTVNRDFTVSDLRSWLQHHQGALSTQKFHLMEVTGFPPRKLDNLSATIEELGLTKTSSLACRPA